MSDAKQAFIIYEHQAPGYQPILVNEGWIVACLNYLDATRPENVAELECHLFTEEVFILVEGDVDLITVVDHMRFVPMERGKAYSIGKGVWHGLVMAEGSQCFIVKSPHPTGSKDVKHRGLTSKEIEQLRRHYGL